MSNEQMAESVDAAVLAALGEKLCELIGALDLDIQVGAGEDHAGTAYFNLSGKDTDAFLNNKAEPLKSIAFLLQAWHDHVHGENGVHVKVDADGELHQRELELREMAEAACAAVTEPGQEYKLDPLNPYDRRVVHMILSEKEGYVSESVGQGHFKSMIIRKG